MTAISPGLTESSAAAPSHRRWRDQPITKLRGTIGAVIVIVGFIVTDWRSDARNDAEANERSVADCQSLNDRTRFGLMSREKDVEQADEQVAKLQERVNEPLDPADFPGYGTLDESTQVFVQGLIASAREEALIELADAREAAADVKGDLDLYIESIPLLDCNRNDDIDDGDFTGR